MNGNEKEDILVRLTDLHKQATTDKSHYYTASLLMEAMQTITELRGQVHALRQLIRES